REGSTRPRAEPRQGFAERGKPRCVAADLSLGIEVAATGRISIVLQRSPAGACRGVGFGARSNFPFGLPHQLLLELDVAAHLVELIFNIGEAVLAGEAPGCPGWRIGRDGKTIPTPEIPVARDEPLSWL